MPSSRRSVKSPLFTMILEGIVTTVGIDGGVNIAPMGPHVDLAMNQFVLRPFRTSTTYRNLKHSGEGVFHVTDDVWLLAHTAIGGLKWEVDLTPTTVIQGQRLTDCCRWYEFRVQSIDDRSERTEMVAQVVAAGQVRDFFGFNRGKHAVVEAAILATRVGILPPIEIHAEMKRLQPLVEKTGGDQEHRAFQFLREFMERKLNFRL
ncbi:MAG: DUF447 family protein [Pirellulales bacterium]|nr:DUF447 family protein [Pirellulales bacterium]